MHFLLLFLSSFIYLFIFIFRQRGREGERGQKHQHVVASRVPPTGNLACNPGVCPDWELNQRPFGSQAGTQSTESHQPGQKMHFLLAPSCGLCNNYSISKGTNVGLKFWRCSKYRSLRGRSENGHSSYWTSVYPTDERGYKCLFWLSRNLISRIRRESICEMLCKPRWFQAQ